MEQEEEGEEEEEDVTMGEGDLPGEEEEEEDDDDGGGEEDEEEDDREKIPGELLTRILHEFFEREGTRVTRDANAAVVRYVDVFVREAIARAAAERDGGFLEVSLIVLFSYFPCDGLLWPVLTCSDVSWMADDD